jgi:glycosyltransferase involved in cell wall biosynthesis
MRAKIGVYVSMQLKGGGTKRALVLADHLSRTYDVRLLTADSPDAAGLEKYFDVDLSRVEIVALEKSRLVLELPHRLLRARRIKRWSAQLSQHSQIKALGLNLFINNWFGSDLVCPTARGIYMCMFPWPALEPPKVSRRLYAAYHALTDRAESLTLGRPITRAIGSYSLVTANSRYTAEWAKKIWGVDCPVVYSARDDMGPAAPKEKIILNLGRFAMDRDGNYYKRQEALLDAFKRSDIHKAGWELHLAGSIDASGEMSFSTAPLVEAGAGYPVFFHCNPDFAALRALYRRASIYWHATGYGSPERPELQEHFGVAPLEAMSAGAVPVVINSGGHRETVTHGVDGFLWNDLEEMLEQTKLLIGDAALFARMSRQAVLSSAKFSRAAFIARMDPLIESLLSGASG